MVTRISLLVFTKWRNKVKIWQNLEKNTLIFLLHAQINLWGRKIMKIFTDQQMNPLKTYQAVGLCSHEAELLRSESKLKIESNRCQFPQFPQLYNSCFQFELIFG